MRGDNTPIKKPICKIIRHNSITTQRKHEQTHTNTIKHNTKLTNNRSLIKVPQQFHRSKIIIAEMYISTLSCRTNSTCQNVHAIYTGITKRDAYKEPALTNGSVKPVFV
ncbi:hypothetical protein B5X24_HaOG206295 [Helicoverpa armigera]|nr:hypothetical protein B5X24_HaOG206295 [Helicoverpa armigera]